MIHATTRRMRRVDAISPVGVAADPALIGQVEVVDLREIVGRVSGPTDMLPAQVGFYVNDLRVAATWSQESSELTAAEEASGSFRIPQRTSGNTAGGRTGSLCRSTVTRCRSLEAGPIGSRSRTERRLSAICSASSTKGSCSAARGDCSCPRGSTLSGRLPSSLYDQVSDVVRERHGHELFAIYGTLLGMVREGGFIGHDNDFDVAYISASHDGRAAAREVGEIAVSLIDAGFEVECRRTALHIHDRHNPRTRMDVFHLYFDDHGDLAFPYGVAGSSVYTRSDWRGLQDQRIPGTH